MGHPPRSPGALAPGRVAPLSASPGALARGRAAGL